MYTGGGLGLAQDRLHNEVTIVKWLGSQFARNALIALAADDLLYLSELKEK